ncbi:hypothetical protein ACF0H5_020765 [Mactra antiquata]
MGGVYLHHITMLVSEEQEDAIRFLFEANKWKCWMKALLEETVTQVMENGFAEIFPESCNDDVDENDDNIFIKAEDLNEPLDDACQTNEPILSDGNELKELSDLTDVNEDILTDSEIEPKVCKRQKVRTSSRNKHAKHMKKTKAFIDKVKNSDKMTKKVERNGKEKRNDIEKGSDKVKSNDKTKGKVKCPYCDMYVVNQYILKRHCQRRHQDVWFEFKCKDCPCGFKTQAELWQHRNEVNHKPPDSNPKREEKNHHTPEELAGMGHVQCSICDKYYPNKRLLRRHLYAVHRDLLPKWNCAVCSTEFETRDELWAHKRETKHNTSIWTLGHYQCDSCGKIYHRYDSFRLHKKVACNKEEKEIEELRVHPCDICGLSFKSMHHVSAHKRGVHLDAPEVCHICGTICKNKRALVSHQKRHDINNKKYSCEDCGKAFFNSTILKQHIRTHTKERPFKCPMCAYVSAVKQNIHKHSLKVHKVQAQAIDLRKNKDKSGLSEDGYSSHEVDHAPKHLTKNDENSLQYPKTNMTHDTINIPLNGAVVSLPEEDKLMMKMTPPPPQPSSSSAVMNNMMIPGNSTSYLELMNYPVNPTDYPQNNVHMDQITFQY